MKKILFLLFAVCMFVSCDPTHEDISNGGHITVDELKAKTTVTVDKAADGKNGNVITCSTSAPVNVVWTIADKPYMGNYAWKKMKLGEYVITMTALCADGTELKVEYPVTCEEITDPLTKYYIYGDPANADSKPLVLGSGDAGAGRFSDNEGKGLPFLSDEVYSGKKTLIFDIIEANNGKFIWGDGEGCTVRVMNGWWGATYADDVPLKVGLWELPITEEIAKDCARNAGGKDLDLLMTRGSVTIKSVYYEE